MTTVTLLSMVLGLLAGVVTGAPLYALWLRRKASVSIRLPRQWPLVARVIITNQEHEVMRWLRDTFHDHLIMVKLPVLRFTAPLEKDKPGRSNRWEELLSGVYCTFTVCTPSGNVVGCVDVPGKRGLGKAHRELKESLLSDCRIAYTVVRGGSLPKASAMRAAFLGEIEVQDQVEEQVTRGGDSSFHADLDSFTRQKKAAAKEAALKELNKNVDEKSLPRLQPVGFNSDGSGASGSDIRSGRLKPQFLDSFTHGDESRPAKLN